MKEASPKTNGKIDLCREGKATSSNFQISTFNQNELDNQVF